MATLESVRSRVRLEIGDQASIFSSTREGDGTSVRFELPASPVDPHALTVVRAPATGGVGQSLAPGTYGIEPADGVIVLTSPLGIDEVLTVTGTAYKYFNDDDLDLFVATATAQHLYNRPLTLATLPLVEEYPLALVAAIEALYALLNDAAFDIDVSTPEGVGIPRSQRFRQLQEMIELRKAQYQELASALNIGIGRIEVFNLRRVSRTTGRLVPNFVPQEIEDRQPPTRVFTPIDTHGGPVIVDPTPILDLEVYEWGFFTLDLEGLGSLSGYKVDARVRRYEDSSSLREITVTRRNDTTGAITLDLGPQQTGNLPPRLFWDLRLTNRLTREVKTLRKGTVTVIQQVGVDESVGQTGSGY